MPRQTGAVAAGHELTARAGAEALARGGNAIDAAVAMGFAACTCESTLTGLGGAGFATIHLADGSDIVLDFFAAVPGIGRQVETATGPVPVDVLFGSTPQTFHVGPQSVAVPGFIAGLLQAHERFGRLPRAEMLEPAIRVAREGMHLTEAQAYCHHILEKVVTRRPYGRATFAPDGPMLQAGDFYSQPRLGDTLEHLAEHGADSFYRGELAREVARWADEADALLTLEDLERYSVREFAPVRCRYRSLEFLSVPPPSSGGALVAYALRVLDGARGDAVDVGTPEGAALLVGAMIAANSVRGAEFDRYLYGEGLVEWLLSPDVVRAGVERASGTGDDAPVGGSRLGSTTHASAIDAEGNAVAITTSTGCGSGEFVGTTGIHLNNMLGEEDLVPVEHTLVPGDRLTSMMAPSLLLVDGAPLLATGSAGSNRLRSAIFQTLLRVVESRYIRGSDMTLQQRLHDAVATGRLHAEAGLVHAEPDFGDDVLDHLRSLGHHVSRWPRHNLYFGGVNMVAVTDDGGFAAAADPRRGGGTWVTYDDGSMQVP